MKQFVLFSALLGLVACQPKDVAPASPTSEFAGTYRTNGFLDYQWLTASATQMPTATLESTGSNLLTLTLTESFPSISVQTFTDVTLTEQPDQSLTLVQAGQIIGSVQTSRVFTASGMEIQGKLLRLSIPNKTFTGYQP